MEQATALRRSKKHQQHASSWMASVGYRPSMPDRMAEKRRADRIDDTTLIERVQKFNYGEAALAATTGFPGTILVRLAGEPAN